MNEKFLPAARKKFTRNVARQYSTRVSRLVNFEDVGKMPAETLVMQRAAIYAR
jgi:hypothetical protein